MLQELQFKSLQNETMTDFFAKRLDLRKELKVLMETSGFRWVALRTTQLDQPCTECVKRTLPQYDGPPGSCMKCLNTGHLFVDKLVKGYSYLPAAGRDFLSDIGVINTETVVFILEQGSKPKTGDLVCELDLDEATGTPRQPFAIRRVFKIQDSKEMRGDDGRIEFFKTYCEEYNLDVGQNIW